MKVAAASVLLGGLAACATPSIDPAKAILNPSAKCAAVANTKNGHGSPVRLCVDAIDRGWLLPNDSRIVLADLIDFQCVRIIEQSGSELGYDDSRDLPNRSQLQLEPVASQVSFVVDESPGSSTEAPKLFGSALGGMDLQFELFKRRCSKVCASSRGETVIRLLEGYDQPYVSVQPEVDDCSTVGKRAVRRDQSSGASTPADAPDAGTPRERQRRKP